MSALEVRKTLVVEKDTYVSSITSSSFYNAGSEKKIVILALKFRIHVLNTFFIPGKPNQTFSLVQRQEIKHVHLSKGK